MAEKIPFDPHSVATAQTLEEQKTSQEMRAHLAEVGVIPSEAVRPPDIDISRADVPQYKSHPEVQAELDTLNQEIDTRTDVEKLREAEEGLRVLPELFGAKAKPEQTVEASESVSVPPELKEIYGDNVPPRAVALLGKIKGKVKRESLLHIFRTEEEERKKKREERKSSTSRGQKPRPLSVGTEKLKAQMQEEAAGEIRNMAAARAAATAPSGAEDAPTIKMTLNEPETPAISPEAQRLEAEEQREIDERIEAAQEEAQAKREAAEAKAAEAKEPLPEAVQEVEKKEISLAEVENIVREKLKGKVEITTLEITKTSEGLQIQAELQHTRAKKITLKGVIVNKENTIGIQGLNVMAEKWESIARSKIEEGLSGFDSGIKKYFEDQSHKPVSSIQIGETGLTVEFEPPVTAEAEADEPAEAWPWPKGENEGTRSEWYAKLKETVGKVVEGTKEKFNKAKEFLTNEDMALAEKAKILGKGTEKLLLDMGKSYRKAPLKYKIALSAALIGGSVATGGAGTFVTLISAAKLGQRSAGALGVYTLVNGLMEKRLANKEEKGIERGKWDNAIKQFVSGGAALAVFSGLPGTVLKEGFDAAGGERLTAWLGGAMGHLFSHDIVPPPVEPAPKAPVHTPGAQVPRVAVPSAPAAPEIQPPAAPVEMPKASEAPLASHTESVATPEAHEPAPAETPKVSEAIAPEIKEPVVVAPEIEKLEADEGIVITDIQVPDLEPVGPFTAPTETAETLEAQSDTPLPTETIVSPDTTVTPVDITNAPEFVSQPPIETPPVESAVETSAPVPEAAAPAPVEQSGIIQNHFGLTIPVNESHLYSDAQGKGLLVFGGSPQEQAKSMLEYFQKDPTRIIYAADETGTKRIPWRFIQGQLVRGEPAQEGWLFNKSFMKPPLPDDLAKRIK